jgi:hypothetical protein
MQPVRRRVRRHFGLTAKNVSVRSHRPWYFQTLLALMFVAFGYGLAYWMLHRDDIESVRENLKQKTLENKELEVKLIGTQRELQVELATNNNLAKELASVQDESLKTKADLFFYKNMLGKKSK